MGNYDNEEYEELNKDEIYRQYGDNAIMSGTELYDELIEKQQKKRGSCITDYFGLIMIAPFLGAGLIFMIVGAVIAIRIGIDKSQCTEKTTGTVIANVTWVSYDDETGEKRETYAPVFRYTYKNITYTVKGVTYSQEPDFSEGVETEIYVDPDSPRHIYVPGYAARKGNAKMLLIVGGIVVLLFSTVPVYLLITRRKKVRKQDDAAG